MAEEIRRADINEALDTHRQVVLVMIAQARGSTPRGAGAAMLVTPDSVKGTIGGGAVEWEAIAHARRSLEAYHVHEPYMERALNPDLDQCCGGYLKIAFGMFTEGRAVMELLSLNSPTRGLPLFDGGPEFHEPPPPRQVWIYGAGHVGQAVALALDPLPFEISWLDSRKGAFDAIGKIPFLTAVEETPFPEHFIARAAPDAFHVVMTHSHAEDLEIVDAVLRRGAFGFLGLIGSATKRALFRRRLIERGHSEETLARLTCPIGLPSVSDKRPAPIAALTAAQLLQVDAELSASRREAS